MRTANCPGRTAPAFRESPLTVAGSISHKAYCYGMIAASTLYRLADPFPVPDGYAEIRETAVHAGGEAANAAIVLSRLGIRTRLDGSWIGGTREGKDLLRLLRGQGVDVSRLKAKPGSPGACEIVLADGATRTVFGNYRRVLFTRRQWNRPRKADLLGTGVAVIDPFFGEESLLAARYAAEMRVPFVTVDCPPESPLASSAAAVVISGEFLRREFPRERRDAMTARYRRRTAGLVILTAGEGEIVFARAGVPARRLIPPAIRPLDTTGAGDAFRAGVAAGLLRGWDDIRIVAYACAVAALVCLSFPGVLNSPGHREVMKWMRERFPADRTARGVRRPPVLEFPPSDNEPS
jgi:sugar/nucleoside kinase (ribokinase family)